MVTTTVCASASAAPSAAPPSSAPRRWRRKRAIAAPVISRATMTVRVMTKRESSGSSGGRGARRMRPGSIASKASGRASVTAATRLIQRICTGEAGSSASPPVTGKARIAMRMIRPLAEVGRQHEGQGLDEIVVDAPALLDGGPDGREVVVGEHDVGGFAGHAGARASHRDADVGLLEGRGVVDTVAGHGDHMPP